MCKGYELLVHFETKFDFNTAIVVPGSQKTQLLVTYF